MHLDFGGKPILLEGKAQGLSYTGSQVSHCFLNFSFSSIKWDYYHLGYCAIRKFLNPSREEIQERSGLIISLNERQTISQVRPECEMFVFTQMKFQVKDQWCAGTTRASLQLTYKHLGIFQPNFLNCWWLEIGHSVSIYTRETTKYDKSGFVCEEKLISSLHFTCFLYSATTFYLQNTSLLVTKCWGDGGSHIKQFSVISRESCDLTQF